MKNEKSKFVSKILVNDPKKISCTVGRRIFDHFVKGAKKSNHALPLFDSFICGTECLRSKDFRKIK